MHSRISFSLFLVFASSMFAAFGMMYLVRSGLVNIDAGSLPANAILAIAGEEIAVELARTPSERAEGLSGRTALPEREGLFFVFPESGFHGIWMRDMSFSIDIIWFDDSLEVVDIKEGATPGSYPEVFRPKAPARYVLEVNEGFVEERGITIGSSATFTANSVLLQR